MSDIASDVLDMLVCPHCHHQLTWAYEAHELHCSNPECALVYPVRRGIPILVSDAARKAS